MTEQTVNESDQNLQIGIPSVVIDGPNVSTIAQSTPPKYKNQKKRIEALSRKKKTGCRKEITTEERGIYSKAFIVWALFTLGGWLSIPNEYLPLFSHCVGFGFFLTITTQRTRWFGFLAVGALIFSILMYFSMPPEWVFMVSNSAGYVAMGMALVLAYLCTFASPTSIREGVTNVRNNELYLTGSRYLEEMTRGFTLAPSGQPVPEGLKRLEEDGKSISTDQKQMQTLESAPREDLWVIIRKLNQRLIARDEEVGKMKEATAIRIKRLDAQIDGEVDKRLKAENLIAKQEEQIKVLTEQLHEEKGNQILPVISLEKQLKDSQEMQKRLNEEVQRLQRDIKEENAKFVELEKKFSNLVEKKEKLQKEYDALLEIKHSFAKEEKKSRRWATEKTKLERQLQEEKDAKSKLEKQLQEEKEIKKKSDTFYTNQIKVLSEENQNQMRKLKEESSAELKKRHKQTIEIAQKAESLVRKQQEKVVNLEAELRATREEKRQHRKLCSSLIGGVISDSELSKLTPRQLELLYGEMELGLQRLNVVCRRPPETTGSNLRVHNSLHSSPHQTQRSLVKGKKTALDLNPHVKNNHLLDSPDPRTDQGHLQPTIPGWSESEWSLDTSSVIENNKTDTGEDLLRLSSMLMSSLQASHLQSPSSTGSSPPWSSQFSGAEELSCRICKSSRIDAFLYPCGHPCICSRCANLLLDSNSRTPNYCPICQLPIESWQRLEDLPTYQTSDILPSEKEISSLPET